MRQKPSEQEVKDTYLMRVEYHSQHLRSITSDIFIQMSRALGERSVYTGDDTPDENIGLETALEQLNRFEKTLEHNVQRYDFFKNNAAENPRVQTPALTQHFRHMDAYIRFTKQTTQAFYILFKYHKTVLEE